MEQVLERVRESLLEILAALQVEAEAVAPARMIEQLVVRVLGRARQSSWYGQLRWEHLVAAEGEQCPHHSYRSRQRQQQPRRTSEFDQWVCWAKERASCPAARCH